MLELPAVPSCPLAYVTDKLEKTGQYVNVMCYWIWIYMIMIKKTQNSEVNLSTFIYNRSVS